MPLSKRWCFTMCLFVYPRLTLLWFDDIERVIGDEFESIFCRPVALRFCDNKPDKSTVAAGVVVPCFGLAAVARSPLLVSDAKYLGFLVVFPEAKSSVVILSRRLLCIIARTRFLAYFHLSGSLFAPTAETVHCDFVRNYIKIFTCDTQSFNRVEAVEGDFDATFGLLCCEGRHFAMQN